MGIDLDSETLVEFDRVNQNEAGIRRRWFSDSSYELILWYRERDDELIGFQICFGNPANAQNAMTWADGSFSYRSIIDEKRGSMSNRTPILNGSEKLPPPERLQDFMRHARTLEPEALKYIEDVLVARAGLPRRFEHQE
jgi:hypothetical protein